MSDKCGACLFLGDDYGDNTCTIKCGLEPEHIGLHQKVFVRKDQHVTITWHTDERYNCEKHGMQSSGYCDECLEMRLEVLLVNDECE